MKNTISMFAAVILALLSGACSQEFKKPRTEPPAAVNAAHDSESSQDLSGIYAGAIPSASGSGIEVTMILRADSTYTLAYHYIGRKNADLDDVASGTFRWDRDKGVITLDTKDFPPYYRIDGNRLIQLDMEGNPIIGELADSYVLEKKER
ncbi:MAG: copper resistance protein NlpE [Candidatus Accumulibacter sp.]|jgi:uncharacterized lipoprotein NlpE involved in copper resistance|nr:copper resistance protein NlpE [Accumulibacter sp.]